MMIMKLFNFSKIHSFRYLLLISCLLKYLSVEI